MELGFERTQGVEDNVEVWKRRCTVLLDRIASLPLSKIPESSKRTLLRLVSSELKFLSHLCFSSDHSSISINIGYLESIVHIVQQPFITGVSRVCKPIPVSSSSSSKNVHVDIVCTLNATPVWFMVSDRNPKYISWEGSKGNKGLRTRIVQLLAAARSSVTLKPSSVILFFSRGIDKILHQKLAEEFGACGVGSEISFLGYDFSEELDGEWINVIGRSYAGASIVKIKVDSSLSDVVRSENGIRDDSHLDTAKHELLKKSDGVDLGNSFLSLVSEMKSCSLDVEDVEVDKPEDLQVDLINFDTTALIAIVSGISNGGTENLLATPEIELRKRFKSNYEFVIAQVMSEIQNPMHTELHSVVSGKRGIICASVLSEFKELMSMCGGPNEKLRGDYLLKQLMLVPDSPSVRMMSLPTTRKLALKNKVVFGTGDHWRAPTLTANQGFVRAISQTGMSLFTIEHRPRALTGD
ncbi:protein of unknown function DUF1308 [Dillenia turbinata]|uniref:DUF1308 domain-containing protein n=1 Tax=Dillenia turbinata TaxID=194707 RepID=A0AAN8WG34_9MAGN